MLSFNLTTINSLVSLQCLPAQEETISSELCSIYTDDGNNVIMIIVVVIYHLGLVITAMGIVY